jgi:hypothetical protein
MGEKFDTAHHRQQIDLLGHLKQLQNVCTFCLSHDNHDAPKHSILTCPTLSNVSGSALTYLAWRDLIHYRVGVLHPPICYLCHVPQGREIILHHRFDGDPTRCVFRDLVAPLAYGIITSPDLRSQAQEHFSSTNLSNPIVAMDWINSGMVVPGYPSNLIALFMWYCRCHL